MSSRPKEFQSRSSTSSKPEKDAAVFINLRTCSELYKKQKVDISEAPSNSHSNASKINEFEDPYKEIWQKLWTLRVLKFETDCSAGIKWT